MKELNRFKPEFKQEFKSDFIESSWKNRLFYSDENSHYPLYNIEKLNVSCKDGEYYRITMAVAGFARENLQITICDESLTISGSKEYDRGKVFLHKGISNRSFEKTFQLADSMKVEHSFLKDGLLNIDILRYMPKKNNIQTVDIMTESELY